MTFLEAEAIGVEAEAICVEAEAVCRYAVSTYLVLKAYASFDRNLSMVNWRFIYECNVSTGIVTS